MSKENAEQILKALEQEEKEKMKKKKIIDYEYLSVFHK